MSEYISFGFVKQMQAVISGLTGTKLMSRLAKLFLEHFLEKEENDLGRSEI